MSAQRTNSGILDRLGVVLQNKIILLLFALIIALFVLGEIVSSGFLAFDHVGAVLRTASFLGIVAIGQTVVILTAGIDLSVGPLITMGNVFTCMFMNGLNENTVWSLLAIIALGALFGTLSGLGVTLLNISPLVMTLATGSLVTGVTLIFSQGAPKGLASPILRYIAVGSVFGGIPIVVIIWIALGVFIIFFLRSSTFGRRLYYVGANERAAFMSGVRVKRVVTIAYSISGGMACLTGALMAGYTHTAFLGIGNEYTLWSITAVVIGGTALTGGKGGYLGSMAGAIILVLLESILTVMKMPEAGRRIATGVIILIMISIYFSRRMQRS
jgi:ribose transport system permease protein